MTTERKAALRKALEEIGSLSYEQIMALIGFSKAKLDQCNECYGKISNYQQ